MNVVRSLFVAGTLAALPFSLLACGGEQAQPEIQPQPTPPAPAPVPPPEAEPTAEAPEPADTAEKPPEEAPASKPKPSGRPAILMGPSKNIESTFGATPGAVLKLSAKDGTITWKIPEFSLNAGYNIVWKIAGGTAAKRKPPVVGDVAMLKITLGGKLQPSKVTTSGDDFELRWPTGNNPGINLAVGEAKVDAQGNELKDVSWTVVAPKSVDDAFKEAYFYLHEVGPIMYLHATTAPATEAAPSP